MKKKDKIHFFPISDIEKELVKRPGYKGAREKSRLKYLLIEAIIDARGKRGMTQRELAKELEVTQSALARFESGKVNPTIDFVSKLISGLNLKVTVS